MDTLITLSLRDALNFLIMVGLLALLCYGIALVRNLNVSVKSANKILKDTEVITEVAARRTKDADKILDDASGTIQTLLKTLKGNQSTIGAITSVVNSIKSLKNLMSKQKKAKDD